MKSLIIGLGNPIIGDDAIGCVCAQTIERRLTGVAEVEVDQFYRGGISLMERMIGYDRVLVIDSCIGCNNKVGSVSRLEIEDLPSKHTSSPHDATLKDAIEFGKSLGEKLPDHINVITIGIEPNFEFSERISDEVGQAIPIVVDLAVQWVKEDGLLIEKNHGKHTSPAI